MASEREAPTTTDYVVTALSPILIMLMLGSLVFFLVEVLYDGKYSERLLYTFFFFVLGAVLVARIAIETDASRASAYGLILAIVTYIALLSYVEYPKGSWLSSFGWLVNLGLISLIGWSANKLTGDCTNIDEKKKGAGRGLLSAAGLDADAREDEKPAETKPEPATTPAKAGRKKKGKKKKPESQMWAWIENYKKHREEQRKGPHTPGVWVIYFTLAALPLFALGQSLVAADDEDRRRATFLQMAVYMGSALGLLVTTSFLALRRYLRQRKARIPLTMTISWLGFGGTMIAVFLVLGAFLPRPHSEVPWFGIPKAGKSDREASRYAVNKSSAGKGEGTGGNETKAGDGNTSGKNGKPGGGNKGDKGSGGKGQKGNAKSGQKGNSSGKSDSGDKSGNDDDKSEEKSDENNSKREGKTESEEQDSTDKSSSNDGSRESSSSPQLSGMLDKVAGFLKWVVFAIVAILVVVGLGLAILRYLAPFTDWARRLLDALKNWWAGLFSGTKHEGKKADAENLPVGPLRPPPFHEFSNPFADGSADGRDLTELVDYTFLALDSWAWDQNCGRDLTETPLEFCSRLAEAFPDIAEALGEFGRVYAPVNYSKSKPPVDSRTVLEQTWEGLVYGVAVG